MGQYLVVQRTTFSGIGGTKSQSRCRRVWEEGNQRQGYATPALKNKCDEISNIGVEMGINKFCFVLLF